jgi:hypothetical protein
LVLYKLSSPKQGGTKIIIIRSIYIFKPQCYLIIRHISVAKAWLGSAQWAAQA